MKIFAIDPGSTQSAYVIYDCKDRKLLNKGIVANSEMKSVILSLREDYAYTFAIEMVACYGMPVGKDVFETVLWAGRFVEMIDGLSWPWDLVYRREVKMYLCQSTRARDSNIRQAIIDRFPASGGGKNPQVGTKKQPGPLFGVLKDIWAALGVALTFAGKNNG